MKNIINRLAIVYGVILNQLLVRFPVGRGRWQYKIAIRIADKVLSPRVAVMDTIFDTK